MPAPVKQKYRPLTTAGYFARAKRMRELIDTIERYVGDPEIRAKQQLTRAIYGLSHAARDLSEKHRRATIAE